MDSFYYYVDCVSLAFLKERCKLALRKWLIFITHIDLRRAFSPDELLLTKTLSILQFNILYLFNYKNHPRNITLIISHVLDV